LAEFKARAPADTIALVFASENLAKPASMMRHILLKLQGRDPQGRSGEQRSIWEYELQLDPVRKQWVIAHW
jgi:hypothetical protein